VDRVKKEEILIPSSYAMSHRPEEHRDDVSNTYTRFAKQIVRSLAAPSGQALCGAGTRKISDFIGKDPLLRSGNHGYCVM